MKTHALNKTLKSGPRGAVYFPEGGYYRGDWLNDLRHGNGCMVYRNGDRYFGGWVENLREGVGAFYHCVDEQYRLVYSGQWQQDQPSGYGVFYDERNCRYEGQWVKGKRHGMGKLLRGKDEQPIYEGQWVDDLREGQGKERSPDGNIFVGHFERDKRHGSGSYFLLHKQKRLDGVWQEGTFKGGTYSQLSMDPSSKAHCTLPVVELKHPQCVVDKIMAQHHSSSQTERDV